MEKIVISTDKAPQAIGPYEQGIKAGNLLFTAGQIPINPSSGEMILGGIAQQTDQVIKNIEEVLTAGGSSLNQVIKITIFLTNLTDFARVNEVFERYFENSKPARSCVEVSALPKGAQIEMEAVALVSL